MPQLTLNCPTCRKRLIYVPLDGLTLHYRCEEHGLVILRPLQLLQRDERIDSAGPNGSAHMSTHDAA